MITNFFENRRQGSGIASAAELKTASNPFPLRLSLVVIAGFSHSARIFPRAREGAGYLNSRSKKCYFLLRTPFKILPAISIFQNGFNPPRPCENALI